MNREFTKNYFRKKKIKGEFEELWAIIKILRKSCPWDKSQTVDSLKFKLIEEAYEAVDSVPDVEKFSKEIGDVILVALFLVRILEDEKKLNLKDVLKKLIEKLIEKHPHVFGETKVKTAEEVLRNWEKNKPEIKEDNIPLSTPALYLSFRIGSKLKYTEKFQKIFGTPETTENSSEIILQEKIKNNLTEFLSGNKSKLGELLLNLGMLSAIIDVNPEEALRERIIRFMEELKDK